MSIRSALVTGGAGFIGSHVCRLLAEHGVETAAYDNLSVGAADKVPPGVTLLEGDVLDTARLYAALKDRQVEVLFHLAAHVSIRASVARARQDARTNVLGTLSALEACADTSVRRVVFASSMAVYADAPAERPVGEAHPVEPLSPYGVGKLAGEQYVRLLCQAMGLESVCLRYFNTYGPGQTYTPYVGVITIFVRRALAGEPLLIYGDGLQTRDFVHVSDVARATVLAAESSRASCVCNVGTSVGTTVNRIAALVAQAVRPDSAVQHVEAQATELRYSVADITRAHEFLGYLPQRRLAEALPETIAAIRAQSEPR